MSQPALVLPFSLAIALWGCSTSSPVSNAESESPAVVRPVIAADLSGVADASGTQTKDAVATTEKQESTSNPELLSQTQAEKADIVDAPQSVPEKSVPEKSVPEKSVEPDAPRTQIEAGDLVVVMAAKTELVLADDSVAPIAWGTPLRVAKVEGDWIFVEVAMGEAPKKGWVRTRDTERLERVLQQLPKGKKAAETKPAPAPLLDSKPSDAAAEKTPASVPALEGKPTSSAASDRQPALTPALQPKPTLDETLDRKSALIRALEGKSTTTTEKAPTLDATSDTTPQLESSAAPKTEPATADRSASDALTASEPKPSASPPAEARTPVIRYVAVGSGSQLKNLDPSRQLEYVVLLGNRLTDWDLDDLEGLNVTSLSIQCPQITNSGLARLALLPQLKSLSIWGAQFGDSSLEHVLVLSELEALDIDGTAIQGKALRQLKDLPELRKVVLGRTIQDADLLHLGALPKLDEVDLRNCSEITDDGLAQLGTLTGLRRVWIPKHISDGGRQMLRSQLPDCECRR